MSRLFVAANLGASSNILFTGPSPAFNVLGACTLAAWIYPVSNATGAILVKSPIVVSPAMYNFGGPLYGQVPSSGTAAASTASSNLTLNAWQHVAMTFNSVNNGGDGKIRLYVNGVEVSYTTQTAGTGVPTVELTQGFYIGGDTADDNFDGYIAEASVWNTALNLVEITLLAGSGNGAGSIAPLNLVAYWPVCGNQLPEPDISGQNNPAANYGLVPAIGPASPGRICGQLATGSTTNLVYNDNANIGVTDSGVVFKNPNKG